VVNLWAGSNSWDVGPRPPAVRAKTRRARLRPAAPRATGRAIERSHLDAQTPRAGVPTFARYGESGSHKQCRTSPHLRQTTRPRRPATTAWGEVAGCWRPLGGTGAPSLDSTFDPSRGPPPKCGVGARPGSRHVDARRTRGQPAGIARERRTLSPDLRGEVAECACPHMTTLVATSTADERPGGAPRWATRWDPSLGVERIFDQVTKAPSVAPGRAGMFEPDRPAGT
jgi:hypothetical protein